MNVEIAEEFQVSNITKEKNVLADDDEAGRLYQIYRRVQSGDNTSLDELFQRADRKPLSRLDEIYKEYRAKHMDNVLDSEYASDNEKCIQEEEWINSVYSHVMFQFSCLNKMLSKQKKLFLSRAKNTGYENGEKIQKDGCSKYYAGEYDVSDFNELMYETVIEVFHGKLDENHCLMLDGRKNVQTPIRDGVSLLKNISYFTSRKINKRAGFSYLDVPDKEDGGETGGEISGLDRYALKEYRESQGSVSRRMMYEEYLEWFKRNDVLQLFQSTSCDIQAIIETIMNCEETFEPLFCQRQCGAKGESLQAGLGQQTGPGLRPVKQKALREMVKARHNLSIHQTNIAKDMELIEQRLLEHLFYSLNYRIAKAPKGRGIYKKESERFLYARDKKAYIKMFSRAGYEIHDESVKFMQDAGFDRYFKVLKKHGDIIMPLLCSEKGKKKYDMVNLLLENYDLINNEKEIMFHIAATIIAHNQKEEEDYRRKVLGGYLLRGLADWEKGYWEAELGSEVLKMKLWSNRKVKHPIRYSIKRENLTVYCGYLNLYFCDAADNVCYAVPKNRRIISKANKKHEIVMYRVV